MFYFADSNPGSWGPQELSLGSSQRFTKSQERDWCTVKWSSRDWLHLATESWLATAGKPMVNLGTSSTFFFLKLDWNDWIWRESWKGRWVDQWFSVDTLKEVDQQQNSLPGPTWFPGDFQLISRWFAVFCFLRIHLGDYRSLLQYDQLHQEMANGRVLQGRRQGGVQVRGRAGLVPSLKLSTWKLDGWKTSDYRPFWGPDYVIFKEGMCQRSDWVYVTRTEKKNPSRPWTGNHGNENHLDGMMSP